MKQRIVSYFQLANTFIGDIYFKVSKHLCKPVSWVIKHKYTPDVKFLIFKYTQIERKKQEAYEEYEEKMKDY